MNGPASSLQPQSQMRLCSSCNFKVEDSSVMSQNIELFSLELFSLFYVLCSSLENFNFRTFHAVKFILHRIDVQVKIVSLGSALEHYLFLFCELSTMDMNQHLKAHIIHKGRERRITNTLNKHSKSERKSTNGIFASEKLCVEKSRRAAEKPSHTKSFKLIKRGPSTTKPTAIKLKTHTSRIEEATRQSSHHDHE